MFATTVISFCGSRTRPAFHLLFKTYSIQHYGREHHFLWSTIPFFLSLSPSSVILIFFHGTTVDSHPPLIPFFIHPPVQLPLLIPTSSRVRRRLLNSSLYTGNRTVGESATAGKVHAHLNKYQGVEHFAKVNLWSVLSRRPPAMTGTPAQTFSPHTSSGFIHSSLGTPWSDPS